MTSTTTSELTGIPYDGQHSVYGRWTITDNDRPDVPFTARLQIHTNGTRTVALVTTGDDPDLRSWELVESDSPDVATFIEQMIAASVKEQAADE